MSHYLTSIDITNIQNNQKSDIYRRAEVVFTVENDEGAPANLVTLVVDVAHEDGITFGEMKQDAIAKAASIIKVIADNLRAKDTGSD
ncbi:hypothetical protein [Methylobacterium isbiliense]|uniref:DUF1659 domain-containing protein n=1 Tax=Methylobacterium isbiliense TaxID=315478 RepID=A0ABQ4SII6_9HYPH|nr:hypothetical protein [Methylobacterium isbiliense]MDN3624485.1 hypothetical protein [Methylobacterium isbiliense]GJE02161.1 hypothetical protein GMJLKIPL_4105 [Methylobacterium isbiliense]